MTEYPYGTTPPPTATPHGYASPDDDADSSLQNKASETAQAGKQAAGDVAQTAADKATDVAEETKKQARNLLEEARSQLSEQASVQHRSLVDNLRSLAGELDGMAQSSTSGGIANELVSRAGARANGAASWLDRREPGDLFGELRSFARQRPGTFLLGAAAAGMIAGRLTRGVVAVHSGEDSDSSTAPARQGSVGETPQPYPATTPTNEYPAPDYAAAPSSAPQYPAPQYPAPQYPAAEYPGPGYAAPDQQTAAYPNPGYPAQEYPAPEYSASGYTATYPDAERPSRPAGYGADGGVAP